MRGWAAAQGQERPRVLRIGYIGSYARGDWGVGSDLDLLILVEDEETPFVRRRQAWRTDPLPVPTDVWVYTRQEWAALAAQGSRFYRQAMQEVIWVYARETGAPPGP